MPRATGLQSRFEKVDTIVRSYLRFAFFALMAAAAAACSVGGGGTSSPVTNLGTVGSVSSGAPTSQSASKSKMAMALHIPATSANAASATRAAAAMRFGANASRHPNLISTASNGLEVQAYDSGGGPVGQPVDFDISGANATPNATCVSDGAGGRNCTITITEIAAANGGTTYFFAISTYATAPTSSTSGFGSAPQLDSGQTAPITFTIGGTATVSVTLGGTVASIKLNVPQSVNGFIYPASVPIGVVSFDAAGEVIISTASYSAPITLQLSTVPSGANGGASLVVNGTVGQTVTSTSPSDQIALSYTNSGSISIGEAFTVIATVGSSVTASATLSPIFVSAATGTVSGTAIGDESVDDLMETTANASDTITLTEGQTFGGTFTITEDPNDTCAQNGEPFMYTYNGVTTSTPPASVTAANGQISFTITTSSTQTAGNGCVYDITDGSGTVVPLQIQTAFTSGNGNGNYNANVPAGLLYISAFSDPTNSSSAVANPSGMLANGAPTNAQIVMVAPTPAAGGAGGLYQITDPNLVEPLGIAHDTAGDVFVADFAGETVNEYPPTAIAPYPVPTTAPAPTTAYAYYTYPSPSPGPSAEPDAPDGLAYNPKTGLLYVVDFNAGQIFALSVPYPPGSVPQARRRVTASASLATRTAPAAALRRLPATSTRTTTARTSGARRFSSAGPTTAATVEAIFNVGSPTNHPAGIAFDASDNLYVSFPQSGLVEKYASVDSESTGGNTYTLTPIATIGGTGSNLTTPTQITVGTDGTIFVGDASTGNVVEFSPTNLTAGSAVGTQSPQYGFGIVPSASTTDTIVGLGFDQNGFLELQPGGANGTPYGTTPAFSATQYQYLPFATY